MVAPNGSSQVNGVLAAYHSLQPGARGASMLTREAVRSTPPRLLRAARGNMPLKYPGERKFDGIGVAMPREADREFFELIQKIAAGHADAQWIFESFKAAYGVQGYSTSRQLGRDRFERRNGPLGRQCCALRRGAVLRDGGCHTLRRECPHGPAHQQDSAEMGRAAGCRSSSTADEGRGYCHCRGAGNRVENHWHGISARSSHRPRRFWHRISRHAHDEGRRV